MPVWPPAPATSSCSWTTTAGSPTRASAGHVADRFAADPKLAVLAFRIVDPALAGGDALWHSPRVGKGDQTHRSSLVTTFIGAGLGSPAVGVPGGSRSAGGVLLRARGERPGLAADGPRLHAGVRRRCPDVPSARSRMPGTRSGTGTTAATASCWPGGTCPGCWPAVYLLDWTLTLTLVRGRSRWARGEPAERLRRGLADESWALAAADPGWDRVADDQGVAGPPVI